MTSVRRLYSRVVERVRFYKELKVSYKQSKAEPAQRQSYVDRIRIHLPVLLELDVTALRRSHY